MQLNLTKTMFMKNGQVFDAPFSLNGTNISECSSYVYLGREVNMANDLVSGAPFSLSNISECSSYVYLGREVNMANDLAPELNRRKRAAWGAFKSVEEVAKKTKTLFKGLKRRSEGVCATLINLYDTPRGVPRRLSQQGATS
ncbi:unnamed protein product [Heligmosomoides polygyrus]|uniref:COesterase domain-containing protein n=1 Tax=Heligmosomoides polygyrus TaxID=6339 RepID=A0A183FXE2_HELPZ|nr:unnamed protein product [Heligmosomoides polygyrus]